MRKIICYLIIVFIIASSTPINTYAKEYQNALEAVNDANSFLYEKLKLSGYYKLKDKIPVKNTNGKTEKKELALYEEYAKHGPVVFENKPVFVYGDNPSAVSAEQTSNGNRSFYYVQDVPKLKELLDKGKYQINDKIYRAFGYANNGSVFANPDFPNDNKGYLSKDKRWVSFPWLPNNRKTLYFENGNTEIKDISDVRDYIDSWISKEVDTIFTPYELDINLNENIYKNDPDKRSKYFAQNALNPPQVENFENCLYIIQPPTEHVWGLGIAFYYWDGNTGNSTFDYYLNYKSFLLKPFDMMDDDELYAQFKHVYPSQPSEKAEPGEEVKVGIIVGSKLNNKAYQGVDYKLKITKKDGTSIPYNKVSSSEIVMTDQKIDIPASGTRFYISFTMPEDSDVYFEFKLNEDGKDPEEINLENNILSWKIGLSKRIPATTGHIDIPYNVLSKSVKFTLADGKDIAAELETRNNGSLFGNAWGQLDVVNNSPQLFKPFDFSGNTVNEAVSGPTAKIIKHPEISTTIHRRDATNVNDNDKYDDPENKKWLNGTSGSDTKTVNNGKISFNTGKAYAHYEYHCSGCNVKEDGSSYCPGHEDDTDAEFNGSTDTRSITTHIYNGKQTIAPKTYKNQIDTNTDTSWTKNLFWTSEPYKFNVIRLMYNMDGNNTLSSPVRVNGQYKRTFTNQNSANSEWKIASRLKDNYKKSSIEKGVLATDKAFSGIEFPIKSGFYFNPAGKYTFKITTVTYKPSKGSTKDHTDLVQAFINAFRYESNLVYKDKNNHPVYLNNQPAKLSGKGYVGQPAVLSVNSVGLDGRKWMEVEYNKNSTIYYTKAQPEVIEYPKVIDERTDNHLSVATDKDADAKTDARWKNILEGYTESGTLGSFNSYKYREYINDKQDENKEGMYKITETSTVTIKVNPANMKAYTHDRMADGDYYVKAWVADIPFAGNTDNAYKVLPALQGISTLDRINIKVVGSKSDDINFSNQ